MVVEKGCLNLFFWNHWRKTFCDFATLVKEDRKERYIIG